MNKMINFRSFLSLLILSQIMIWGTSCRDFLNIDNYFDDEFNIDSAFVNVRNMEAYMWGAATLFSSEDRLLRYNYTPGPMATDEAFNGLTGPTTNNVYFGIDFATGFITPDYWGNRTDKYSLNQWPIYYRIIRKCNNVLNNLQGPSDMTGSDHRRIEGYTRFFRAYAYYHILMDYGPPILLGDEIVNTNDVLEAYDRQRSTYDEAVEYICNELEEAANFMPLEVSQLDFGQPTKGAALGLIARIRLIHASPLFNGGSAARSYYGNWIRKGQSGKEDEYYVSQEYDEERWAIAAAAAKRVMDLKSPGGAPMYKLYTFPADDETPKLPEGVTSDPNFYDTYPDGAAGIDPFKSYKDIFDGEAIGSINPEYIWGKNADKNINEPSTGLHQAMIQGVMPAFLGGWNRFCVPQKIIDNYLMDDGRSIEEATSDGYYSESGFTTQQRNFSGYLLPSDTYNMYKNREMRFYASIGFNNAYWPALSSSTDNRHIADYFFEHEDGRGGVTAESPNYPITGYVGRKWVNDNDALKGTGARRVPKSFPVIRYAEILLSYAEALNNLTSNYSVEVDGHQEDFYRNTEEIKNAFNKVRYRAGLPGLTQSQLGNAEEVQKQIVRERMVEFLWENRRFYDVRRWGIYEEVENEPIIGMNADGSDKASYYQRVIPGTSRIRGRVIDKKLVWLPLPRAEMNRLPSLDQNPGY